MVFYKVLSGLFQNGVRRGSGFCASGLELFGKIFPNLASEYRHVLFIPFGTRFFLSFRNHLLSPVRPFDFGYTSPFDYTTNLNS